jgi:hypothetical protein
VVAANADAIVVAAAGGKINMDKGKHLCGVLE